MSKFGPKLKFYLFPLTRPTLEKAPSQKILLQFSVKIFFFNFIAKLKELSNLKKLFVYLILLPIVGLCSKTCLTRPLKDIHNKGC